MGSLPVRRLTALATAVLGLLLAWQPVRAEAGSRPEYYPGVHDSAAVTMLLLARNALAAYPGETSELERRLDLGTAVDALAGLYQLYGCEWALTALQRTAELPECPELLVGYSADGRLKLRVDRLDLKNPDYAGAAVLLVTLTSRTSLDLTGSGSAVLEIAMPDGTVLRPVPVDANHPQWDRLANLAATFLAPAELGYGSSVAFKQFFSADVPLGSVSSVSLVWGNYGIVVPNYMQSEGL